MPTYKLYINPMCPFCQKVLMFMDENKVELPLANINEGSNLDDLRTIGGSGQVPALLIDDKMMYESDDIIAYIRENIL